MSQIMNLIFENILSKKKIRIINQLAILQIYLFNLVIKAQILISKYVAVSNTIIFKENLYEFVGPIAYKNKYFHSIITITTM